MNRDFRGLRGVIWIWFFLSFVNAPPAWGQSVFFGNVAPAQIIDAKFTTVDSTGAPATLSGSPVVKCYKGNSTTTEVTTGVTLSVDFDGVTGLNNLRIDTSADGTFYAAGSDIACIITTGTSGGVSVVGYVPLQFAIRNRETLVVSGTSAGMISLASGLVTVGTNNDKTGYSLTQAFPTNFADLAITASTGLVSVGTNNDKTGYSLTQAFPSNFSSLVIDASGRIQVQYGTSTGQLSCTAGVCNIDGVWGADLSLYATGTPGQIIRDTATLADLFLVDTGETAATAVPGSLVGELYQTTASLSDFFTVDTGQTATTAVPGSVVGELYQNTATLSDFFTVDTGVTYGDSVAGSVVREISSNATATSANVGWKKGVERLLTFKVFKRDGTPATGLVNANFTSKLRSCDGAAYVSFANAISEVGRGLYKVVATASETNCNDFWYLFEVANVTQKSEGRVDLNP